MNLRMNFKSFYKTHIYTHITHISICGRGNWSKFFFLFWYFYVVYKLTGIGNICGQKNKKIRG